MPYADPEKERENKKLRNARYRAKHADTVKGAQASWQKRHGAEWARIKRKRSPEQVRAREAVAYAKRVGKLTPEPCLFCDDKRVQAHHHNYSLKLAVTWLCAWHHRLIHKDQT